MKFPALHVTLWPAFPHFARFASDRRIQGIRLNSAMMLASEIDKHFESQVALAKVPLWFDIKGMQLRIKELICDDTCDHLELRLNRPISCDTPCPVWFKGGEDMALLSEIRDGNHLVFEGGPQYKVKVGESLHIRNPELQVHGPTILPYEIEKIDKIKGMGFTRWYLSYVYNQRNIDEFRELIGPDARLILKIENKQGLEFVNTAYKPQPNTLLAAARGDLFVEVDKPHHIMKACKDIIRADAKAVAGSRMLLSLINGKNIPSCADLSELAWLYDIGYRNFLLCDELCLKEELLGSAINVFSAFRKDYPDA